MEKTQEVLADPEKVLKSRQLPKSGTEALEFETEDYLKEVEKARQRVMASFKELKERKGDGSGDYVPLRYDAEKLRDYYDKQPLKQISRTAEVMLKSSRFLASIAGDVILRKKFEDVERQRTIEVRELIVDLGATFIKIGQAVSIRPDIISPV